MFNNSLSQLFMDVVQLYEHSIPTCMHMFCCIEIVYNLSLQINTFHQLNSKKCGAFFFNSITNIFDSSCLPCCFHILYCTLNPQYVAVQTTDSYRLPYLLLEHRICSSILKYPAFLRLIHRKI